MHGPPDFLCLDVNGVGHLHDLIRSGQVLTVEPGIYIRIENDIVFTEDGLHGLMAQIPLEADAFESVMNRLSRDMTDREVFYRPMVAALV